MIDSISIKNVATFDSSDHKLDNLDSFNFIFGSNGSGKTTISRVLANPDLYKDSVIVWKNNVRLSCAVYNVDFVRENFSVESEMPGIFTLGKEEKDTKEKIKDLKSKIEDLDKKIEDKQKLLYGEGDISGKKEELNKLKKEIIDIVWLQKQKYEDTPIRPALEGVLNSKEKFFDKIFEFYEKHDNKLITYQKLEEQARSVFSKNITKIEKINNIDFAALNKLESSDILSKKIIGKEDVDIGGLIKKLDNSDWVKKGVDYLDKSDNICPFCQRPLIKDFRLKLEEYFDETYSFDIEAVKELKRKYSDLSKHITEELNSIIKRELDMLDNSVLVNQIELLNKIFEENIRKIEQKAITPSAIISIDATDEIIENIQHTLNLANEKIQNHNNMVERIGDERIRVKNEVWCFLANEVKVDIERYNRNKDHLISEIGKLEKEINSFKVSKKESEDIIKEIQAHLTSVIPTKDLINEWLDEFGFKNFRLETGQDEHSYSIVRSDGSLVKDTLSEGERNFITFLYFYASLRGNKDYPGDIYPKVVVIDDPVSSLDSDVLFIVSTLIRRLIWSISNEDKNTNIKQLFVLTHNLYFYKEVTFNRNLPAGSKSKIKFWVVRKHKDFSNIINYKKNPIKSTYQLLWDEVKAAKENPALAEQSSLGNTMRKILEYYFNFYGNIELSKLPLQFDGDDRLLVRSLLSWVNDSSHSEFIDDLSYTLPMDDAIERYLLIFERIFDKTGHSVHYKTMMKIND